MKIAIIFGSQSDKKIYEDIQNELQSHNFKSDLYVLSAHRNPHDLKNLIQKNNYDIYIAGAGLAAHLPGVIASLTESPVIGVAVDSCFNGFDAFMSIVQMPKGVPVLAVHCSQIKYIPQFLKSKPKIASINIDYSIADQKIEDHAHTILVPIFESNNKNNPQKAFDFFEKSLQMPFWVGVGRFENAENFKLKMEKVFIKNNINNVANITISNEVSDETTTL